MRYGPLDEAQGGSALHPRPGQLRGRHPASGHAPSGHRPQSVRACPHQLHQHGGGAEDPRRARGHHRRDAQAVQPALDADPDVRHPDGAADREGHVPGAGSGGGHRDGPLRGGRRGRGGGGGLRPAAGRRRSVQGAGAGRAGAAHRQGRQDGQPHLPLGSGRPRRDGGRPRRRRRRRQAGHLHPAHPRRVHRDLRLRRGLRSRHGQAEGLHDDPGAARHPHGAGPGGRARRAVGGEDPGHLPRHRRRVRRQGARLSGVCARNRRVRRRGKAGQVGRGPDGEPAGRLVRARLSPEGRAGGDEGRHAHGAQDQDGGRPRLHGRRRQPVEVPGGPLLHRHRVLRSAARLRRGGRRVHEQAAGRHRLPLLVPGDRGGPHHRAAGRRHGPRARDGPGGLAPQELRARGPVPLQVGAGVGVRQRQLPRRPREGDGAHRGTPICGRSRRRSGSGAS